MNDDQRGGPAAGAELRARALRRLLPALVHRLNNALAVVQCVHDLGSDASASEREHASEALLTLRESLERLAGLARAPVAGRGPSAPALFRTQALLVGALASSLGVELELCDGALPEGVDGELADSFFDLSVTLLSGASSEVRVAGRLRLATRALGDETRVTLTAVGVAPGADAREALAVVEALARTRGWRLASRWGGRSFGVRLGLPVRGAGYAANAGAGIRTPRRVLLLHGAGAEREELAAFLREQGLVVSELAEEPLSGAFELALVEQRLAMADGALQARLRKRCVTGRIELLAPRTSPATLLQLVR